MGGEKPAASPTGKRGQGRRHTLAACRHREERGGGGGGYDEWGLGKAPEAARTRGVFLFLYRNHIHKTSHFLTKKKNNIYIIYISH